MERKSLLGQNLMLFRKEKKISQLKMSELLSQKLNTNILNSSISHWEKGDYAPPVDILFAYCDILEVSMSDLYGREDANISNKNILSPIDFMKKALIGGCLTEELINKLNDEELSIILNNAKSLAENFINRK